MLAKDIGLLDVRNAGRVEFYYKPTFFVWGKNAFNLSYVESAITDEYGLIVELENKTRVRFTDPDIIARLMKMVEG